MTDAESIAELEEMLRQRDARIAELERIVGELSKVIEAWKRGHRVRPGGKIAQKPRDKRRATGRGPGRPEGYEGTSRPAPTSADRDVPVPVPSRCSCGGIIEPTEEEPGEHFVEELIPARKEVIRFRRCRGRCRDCKAAVLAPLPGGLGPSPKLGVRAQAEIVQTKSELGLTLGQTKKLFERQGLTVSRAGLLPGGVDDAAARAGLRHGHQDVTVRGRRGGTTGALVALGTTGTTTRRAPLVTGLLRDLAAGADTMAALPRLDHLAQLTDDPLQLRDPRVALAQRLLQLGDPLGVGHAVSRALVAPKKQDPRERPAGGQTVADPTASLIELNR